ncbi:hotdog family protein [Halopseudomonas salegens]|uniref:ApeI dehydratase-like domain-containing protein n=1 Tax=Halopseudomonas salegens TaxID=1434072 RepID=A0A1H2GUV6_9GAMM|nr:hypothetical protein [Halopseudomonas salegens]SDU23311.1 hypothetical protein SAMN05216210_2561 [Halopseudomonas salegens]
MPEPFIVEADAPCVQGHFPGMPVVPGAWVLGKVHAALLARYPDCRVEALKKVKFLAPLLPDQTARISIDDRRWPRVHVSVEHPIEAADTVQILDASFVMSAA